MPTHGLRGLFRGALFPCLAAFLALFLSPAQCGGQERYYSRANSFGIFAAYSEDSSHMLLGYARQRRLLEFGASYNRRLLMSRFANWQYSGEILPLALESDPLSLLVNHQASPSASTFVSTGSPMVSCTPITEAYSFPGVNSQTYSGIATLGCHGRRWTIGEAMSPVGMQWNFRPAGRLQPLFALHGGYMFSSRQIPVASAGSFNFTFDIGAGFELYRTQTRSIRFEYRYHHISNRSTAPLNPGIDNGLIQATYVFGR